MKHLMLAAFLPVLLSACITVDSKPDPNDTTTNEQTMVRFQCSKGVGRYIPFASADAGGMRIETYNDSQIAGKVEMSYTSPDGECSGSYRKNVEIYR